VSGHPRRSTACERIAIGLFFGAISITSPRVIAADASPAVFATVTCTPASKPGRIKCRAVLELPIEAAAKRRLAWGELVVVSAGSGVSPLRGRLGPLDAETHDDARFAWSFSVAAAETGDRTMEVALRGALEPKPSGPPTPVERRVSVTLSVAP
jgi:hypothetical protein